MNEVFVARQPIFDRQLALCGYELLYRSGQTETAQFLDGDHATASVIVNAFTEFDLDEITGGHPAFLNLTRRFLVEANISLPHDRVVLEVLEDIEPDAQLIQALKRLSAAGYRIALDDFLLTTQRQQSLVPLADIVKVDVLNLSPREIAAHARTLRQRRVPRLLAEKVENQEVLSHCRDAGFDYFQGFFFSRPSTLSRRSVPPSQLPLLRLIAALHDPERSVQELETIISQDVSLSYRLLRYLASPLFSARNIDSIRTAILYLGRRYLSNWAMLMAVSSSADQPPERLRELLIRARLCELLARGAAEKLDPSNAFTIGLLSGLDAVLDTPLPAICDELSISDATRSALLERRGPYGPTLERALAQIHGEWDRLEPDDLTAQPLTATYLEAVAWAEQTWGLLASQMDGDKRA